MTEETKSASAEAGSAAAGPAAGAAAGEPKVTATPDNSKNYEELEKKFGEQGKELGEHRTFIKNIEPLLNKLDTQPELIQAIMDGKIDQKLVTAVLEGKVKIEEAQQVAAAHEQVKQEMGKKAFEGADAAEIEKRILDQALKAAGDVVEQRFKNLEEQKQFEDTVVEFINTTPDFPEYADKISVWLNEHPDQDDVEVAYHAVKGLVLSEKVGKDAEKATSEAAKAAAANAGGGSAPSSGQVDTGGDIWDKLVSKRGNPNSL